MDFEERLGYGRRLRSLHTNTNGSKAWITLLISMGVIDQGDQLISSN